MRSQLAPQRVPSCAKFLEPEGRTTWRPAYFDRKREKKHSFLADGCGRFVIVDHTQHDSVQLQNDTQDDDKCTRSHWFGQPRE